MRMKPDRIVNFWDPKWNQKVPVLSIKLAEAE